MSENELISRREAARRLGVSYSSVVLYQKGQQLGTVEQDGQAMVPAADVEALLEERLQTGIERGSYLLVPESVWKRMRDGDSTLEELQAIAEILRETSQRLAEEVARERQERERLIREAGTPARVTG